MRLDRPLKGDGEIGMNDETTTDMLNGWRQGTEGTAFNLQGLERAVTDAAARWQQENKVAKLWDRDKSLWTGTDEDKWLDWLDVLDNQPVDYERWQSEAAKLAAASGWTDALLLGMGGSSLFPELLAHSFQPARGYLQLRVLDSTVPAEIRAAEQQIDLARTLFIVSSKSGRTLETELLARYFFHRVSQKLPNGEPGQRFIAIADKHAEPSELEQMVQTCRFRELVPGLPGIGGRYSALSPFGMVPAAVMGLDVADFLYRAGQMKERCREPEPTSNPGVLLGLVLAVMAKAGRDKVTFVCSPAIAALAAWLEQLVAESTGKKERGIVPVADEPLGGPDQYGRDRLFVYLRLTEQPLQEQDDYIAAFRDAAFPVVQIDVPQRQDLSRELFRWQIATAVAAAELGLNAFDQPDVQASKAVTWQLMREYEKGGQLQSPEPIGRDGSLTMYADPQLTQAVRDAGKPTFETTLATHLNRLRPGDYFAVNAYVQRSAEHDAALQRARLAVRDKSRCATMLGYGPRLLHSTGQLHKGGPNTGLFLQITAEDDPDLPAPAQRATFGLIKQFQAQGDFNVLCSRARRVLWLHADGPLLDALERFAQATVTAVKGAE